MYACMQCMYACSMHLFMHLFKQCPCTFCSMMNWSCFSHNILSEPHAAFKPGHKPPQVTTVATMSSHHLKQTREIRGAMKSGASTVLGLEMEHRPATNRTHMWFRVSGISSRKWFEKNRPCTCQWHLVEAIRALDSPDLMVLRRDQSFLTLYWLGLVFLMFWGVEMLQNQLFGSSKISGVCSKDSPISMKVTPSLIPKFLPRLRFPSCQRR